MSDRQVQLQRVVAHRGWPARFPENTLPGFSAALDHGATWLEVDVQLTADHVPVLFHDESLQRSCGLTDFITETKFGDLPAGAASFSSRYEGKFDIDVEPLPALFELLADRGEAKLFVELKTESATCFGNAAVLDAVSPVFEVPRYRDRVAAIISFSYELVTQSRRWGLPVGWVLPAWSEENRVAAESLQPEYLFCDVKRLPTDSALLWDGPWQWAGYTVNEAAKIEDWLEYGLDIVETDDIGLL